MELLRLAWRNVGRNKRRSLLSILAVAFACAALMFSMSLQQGSYANAIHNAIHAHAGHFQVQRAGYFEDRDIALSLTQVSELVRLLEQQPEVVAVSPRIATSALVSAGERTFGVALYGIRPEREAAATRIEEVIVEGAYLQAGDAGGILLGEMLARNLGVEVGDEVVFLGQGADGSMAAGRLTVRGLYRFGTSSMDRSSAAAPLSSVQQAFSMSGAVTEIAVLLKTDRQRPEIVRRLRAEWSDTRGQPIAVLGWPELMPGVEQSIQIDWVGGLLIYAVLVLVVGLGIGNTFLMAFMERIHECGVLLSLGMRPGRLSMLLYLESVLLVIVGLGLGIVVGVPLVASFNAIGISFGEAGSEVLREFGLDPVIYPQLTRSVLLWALGAVSGVSLLVAVYPASKAVRLKPVEALRHA